MKPRLLTVLIALAGATLSAANAPSPQTAPDTGAHAAGISPGYAQWKNGVPTDPNYFPIAVWLQSTRNAARYKAAGINLYVGLWRGPTASQLAELKEAGLRVICGQNQTGLENKDNPLIVGWMHGDEPDNAQEIPGSKGYGPPILPERIVRNYERIRTTDPTRPVLLNLGQGVAWDNYIGRGVRRNHPEDYPEYLKGCDIASFDIYPVVHDSPEIAGKLEFVAKGVERLVQWTRGNKVVWNCIECTHISNTRAKATPAQVRSEVWMSLIHGSRGLIYFVHQFKPTFQEAGLLEDPEMLAGVTAINHQIQDLAPMLNSPSLTNGVKVTFPAISAADLSTASPPIAWMQKQHDGDVGLFTVNMRNEPVRASFALANVAGAANVDVLGEQRRLSLRQGEFADDFKPYEVHLYSIRNR